MKIFPNNLKFEVAITLSKSELLRICGALSNECVALNDEYLELLNKNYSSHDEKKIFDEKDFNRSKYILSCELRDEFIKVYNNFCTKI